MKDPQPPKLFLRFFRWFCHPRLQKPIEGDLMELYEERVRTIGKKKADRKFIQDVLLLLRPDIIRPTDGTYRLNNYGMLKNYFKVSMRNILRNKTFSILNISGLAVGIASCILILIYVKNEWSYDTYNQNYDRTYRVLHHRGTGVQANTYIPKEEYSVWGNAPIAASLKDYFPEIETVFRFTSPNPWLIEYQGNDLQENHIIFADSTAFDVFDWKLIAGDPRTALNRPNTIVLTRQLAGKLFGRKNPIGEMLRMEGEELYEVTGIVEVPSNSHFSFQGMISMSTYHNQHPGVFDDWGYVDFYTYLTLNPEASIEHLEESISEFLKFHELDATGYTVAVEPLADAYLHSKASRQPGPSGSLTTIYVFTSVALFVLLIACINFMNLATANSLERAKEVGIRKAMGSNRRALVSQFLIEAILVTLLASLLAAALVSLGHPYLEILSGKELPVNWLFKFEYVLLTLCLIVAIGLLAGSYPAFILSGFKPIKVLKGSFKNSSNGIWLRKALVILQFSLSIILVVGSTVVYQQLNHLREYDLGFNSEQVLIVNYGWDSKVQADLKYIKSEFLKHKDVVSISASRATPGDFFPNAGTSVEGPGGELLSNHPAIYEIDEDFVSTYEMELVAGRNFSADFPSDSSSSLLLNEAAAKQYGYVNPSEIVGKQFKQWGREGKVIGVLKDFNYVSLHSKVEPLGLRYSTSISTSMLSIRLITENLSVTLNELENIWNKLVPHRPFLAHFVDEHFNEQYKADERFGTIFSVFSVLANLVACLGLFGLTVYSTSQRRKEICIRKVLGASTESIVSALSQDFVQLFLIALFMAIPISWFIMKSWLNDFAYRISMGWEIFAGAAFIILLVSFATMSLKTIAAALSNPVDALRNE